YFRGRKALAGGQDHGIWPPPPETHSPRSGEASKSEKNTTEPSENRSALSSPLKSALKGSNRPGGFAPRPRPSSIPSQTSLSWSESLPSLPHNFFGLPPQSTGPRSPAVSWSPQGSTSAVPKTSFPPIYYSTAQTGPPASTSTNWSLFNPTAPLATPRSSHFSHPSTPTISFIRRVASTSALSTLSTEPIFKNQASQTQVPPSSLVLAQDNYQRAEIILSNFHDRPPFSFAEFLRTAFAPEALPHLSPSSRIILATWLQGRTTRGTRPAEILNSPPQSPASSRRVY
ncbi:hypothetical protein FRC11_014415, partial [Ceratobasidium sp. 423]